MWSFHRSDILIIVFQTYFSADILFPWAIYYLYVLQAISDAPCQSSWFENIDFAYDELRAERHAALIQYFVQLLWECVKTHLPPRRFPRSLGLHPYIRSHGILYLLPGFISGVALPLLGYSSKKQGNPHFPAPDALS